MALYVPESRRRRRLLVAVAVALLLGLGGGYAVGRVSAPGLSSYVETARAQARQLAAGLRFVPIEYARQYPAGNVGPGSSASDTVRRTTSRVDAALAAAPWLGRSARQRVRDAVAAVRDAADAKATPSRFRRVAEQAAGVVDDVFGLPSGG